MLVISEFFVLMLVRFDECILFIFSNVSYFNFCFFINIFNVFKIIVKFLLSGFLLSCYFILRGYYLNFRNLFFILLSGCSYSLYLIG